jgi:DNA-directed RNA polymerase specialized sigma subunit
MLGLAQAARSWDPDRGASFERHATTRIRGAHCGLHPRSGNRFA